MKFTLFVAALSLVSALEWVDFTATDQATGLEMPYKLAAKAGGNGGGQKTMSCDDKDGIAELCFQTGSSYLGKTVMKCGDGTSITCGSALGNGRGGSLSCWKRSGAERIRGLVCKVSSNYIRGCKALGKDGKVLKDWMFSRSGTEVSALPKKTMTTSEKIGKGVCGNHDYDRFLNIKDADQCATACKQKFPNCLNVEYNAGTKQCDCDKSTVLCTKNASNSMNRLFTSGWRAHWNTYKIIKKTVPGFDNSKELRAMTNRCGWWMDAVQAGFGNPPAAPKSAAASGGAKNDFHSCGNGDAKRGWFNGPKMAGKGNKLTGSLQYKDQGWGNKKTAVFAQCGSTIKTICPIYTKRPASYVKCNVNLNLDFCKKGEQLKILYRVGGGCGHRFYGKDAKLTVSYKKPQLLSYTFGIMEEFVSPVFEDEIDTPAFVEAQETEIPMGYTVGGAAVVSVVALGAYLLGQRSNRAEYSALLDA